MSTLTTRLGLTLPATSEAYDIAVHNGNMTIIDGAPANLTICTSVTRPSSPDEGDLIYETDSFMIFLRQSGAWKVPVARSLMVNEASLPVSSLTVGGELVHAQDSGNIYLRNFANTAWIYVGGPKLASAWVFTWNADTTLYRNGVGQLKTDGTMFANNFGENSGAATVENTVAAAGTTTSTTFTATLTGAGATTAGVAFVAPASGKVLVHNTMALGASTVSYVFADFEVRTGGSVGSGSLIRSAVVATAMRNADGNYIRNTVSNLVTALTPGATYNVRQMFAINAGTTLNSLDRNIIVVPVPF